jgi:high frequency lysogenization protein
MTYTITDRTISLAAIFQATKLVSQIANTGNADEEDMATCLQSIFKADVDSAKDAYGNTTKLRTGLRTLIDQLGGQGTEAKDLFITKYVAGIMVLEKRLKNDPDMLNRIADGIQHANTQIEHFSLSHENVIAGLANTYSQTISQLKPRIMVQGEHVYISNPNHANRIRALLLAAIRGAVLWRQCGGTRWQLLFQRRAIVEEAKRLLNS